jgi:hypothetical protein
LLVNKQSQSCVPGGLFLAAARGKLWRMAKLAAAYLGQPVEVLRFQDLAIDAAFDGIWACASLLHVRAEQLDDVFGRFVRALKPGGIWYMSFKQGNGQRLDGGRFFTDQTQESLTSLVAYHNLCLLQVWLSKDLRGPDSRPKWLNLVARTRT